MTEQERPWTEAGRELLDRVHGKGDLPEWAYNDDLAAILAIEVEGRQQAVREIREGATAHYRKYGGLPLAVVERILDGVAELNASESPRPTDEYEVRCPNGCGCRIGTADADRNDCACDGYCVMDASDWPRFSGDASESGQPPEASDE